MSCALARPKKGLREELSKKKPSIFQPIRHSLFSEKRRTSHRAFLDVDSLPKIQLNTFDHLRPIKK